MLGTFQYQPRISSNLEKNTSSSLPSASSFGKSCFVSMPATLSINSLMIEGTRSPSLPTSLQNSSILPSLFSLKSPSAGSSFASTIISTETKLSSSSSLLLNASTLSLFSTSGSSVSLTVGRLEGSSLVSLSISTSVLSETLVGLAGSSVVLTSVLVVGSSGGACLVKTSSIVSPLFKTSPAVAVVVEGTVSEDWTVSTSISEESAVISSPC